MPVSEILWKKRMRGSNKTNFLLVEDDANDSWMVEKAFKGAPHCCLNVVQDGKDAMDYLLGAGRYHDRAVYPVPQVILLDLKMPRVNGFELLHWLRHESPGDLRLLPIVIMSSSDMEEDVRRAYALGANSYLVKPIDWKSFDERMQALGIYWAQHVQKPTEAVQ